jgi:hypothetical protein
MVRRILLSGLAAGMAFGAAGCRHCCNKAPLRDRIFGGRDTSPPPGAILGPPVAAPPGGNFIPPPTGGLPSTPAPASPADPGLPPPSVPESRSNRPDTGREILFPDPLPNGPAKGSKDAALEPPAPVGRADLPPGTQPPTARTASGPVVQAGYAARGTPPGLPGFAPAKGGVAVGRRPTVEGFDGLKAAGYKSVVYLHAPGADVSAARGLAEAKGLLFTGVPVAADTLPSGYARFAEIVGAKAGKPAYLCDDDGVRTGTLWYVYFRAVEAMPDDAAQVRAAPLGLRDAAGDDRLKFWQAAIDYLSKR